MDHTADDAAKALFISPDDNIYPDYLVCSGILPADLNGKSCPFSQAGRIPDSAPLTPNDPTYTVDKGNLGDLCPPCAKHQLSSLGHWQGHARQTFPDELLNLRLFKCRQWFWLVIPGLEDKEPQRISKNGHGNNIG